MAALIELPTRPETEGCELDRLLHPGRFYFGWADRSRPRGSPL